MLAQPGGSHTTIIPVFSPDENINPADLSGTNLYTIGGNHLRKATKELLNEFPEEDHTGAYATIQIDLYHGLDAVELRQIGNFHNEATNTLRPSFMDTVFQARYMLFEMAGLDYETDEPPTEKPADFRQKFAKQMSGTEVNVNIEISNAMF